MIVVSSGIAIILVTKISRRINSLVRLAENISRENFGQINDNRRDELSSLSLSLNTMSARLSKSIADLKKRNDELNQFAYVVSHDLKAPVRGIANVVRWIEEDLAREISVKMRGYLDVIPERITRIESLIDGLLEYARIGRDNSAKERVDVGGLIDELVEITVPKDCRVNKIDLPVFFTEKLLLQQAFGNLISNAVKYGNGEITISCLDIGEYYEFSVGDNGPGIPEEYHERIFVIFQTLREKGDKESTGIGLAIVKKIIDDKNCKIRVRSSDAGGATFIFTWPKS
jgi:signal transduction histidine kinase